MKRLTKSLDSFLIGSLAVFLDQVLTMQLQPPSPVREKQDALLKHPDHEGEENLKDQVQKRTAQLIAKEKEVRR